MPPRERHELIVIVSRDHLTDGRPSGSFTCSRGVAGAFRDLLNRTASRSPTR